MATVTQVELHFNAAIGAAATMRVFGRLRKTRSFQRVTRLPARQCHRTRSQPTHARFTDLAATMRCAWTSGVENGIIMPKANSPPSSHNGEWLSNVGIGRRGSTCKLEGWSRDYENRVEAMRRLRGEH